VATYIQHIQVEVVVDNTEVDHEHMLVRDAVTSQELAILVSLWECKQELDTAPNQ